MNWIDRLPGYIEKLARENGESLAALGRAIGKSRQTLSAWKRGDSDPPLRDLAKILDRYGVSLREMADAIGTDPKVPASGRLLAKLESTFDESLEAKAERLGLAEVLDALRVVQDDRISRLEDRVEALEPASDERTGKPS